MEFRHDRGGGNQQERMVAVQDEIRQRKAACNDAAQRCARLCVESEASAAATLTTLYSQGKQLERIDRKLDGINEGLRESKHHVRRIESWWHMFFGRSYRPRRSAPAVPATPRPTRRATAEFHADHPAQPTGAPAALPAATASAAHARQRCQQQDTQDDDQVWNSALNQVSHSIAQLKAMGTAMGDELDVQNEHLVEMTDRMQRTGHRMKHLEKRCQRAMYK
eukprot:m.100428 g.100428  ORF g.100428 m.100428 type:complete len:222 (+) comp15398_c1_seq2:224-889(+)